MKKLLMIIAYLLSAIGMSQTIDSVKVGGNKVKWVNSTQIGLLFDNNDRQGAVGRLTTSYLSGVAYGKFRGMLGLGISDYYRYLIAPVFLELQYAISKTKNSPFVYANGGRGLIIYDNESYYESSLDGGINAGLGIGYRWSVGGVDLFVKSGYQMQTVKSKVNNIYYYDYWYLESFAPPMPRYEVTRRMGRATFMIGLNF